MVACKICLEKNYYTVKFNNLFLRTDSYNKGLHEYEMRVCDNCGVVYQFPQISENSVVKHYETTARKTNFPLNLDENNRLDFPLKFEQTGISFQRFYHFFNIVNNLKKKGINLNLNNDSTILDYGAYQGAFLYACKKIWNVKTIAYDHNDNGLKFAKNFLDINFTYKTKNINEDTFPHEINVCTAIQTVEHLFDPLKFLKHIKKNVLKNNGYVYIEVPSANTSEYSNPSHLFMFTKESLEYLFNLSGLKVLHISEEHIHNFKKITPIKRHVQTMIHCLASTDGHIDKNEKISIGKNILKKVEKSHLDNSNRIYFIRLKSFLREGIILIYYGFFSLLSLISSKFSYRMFLFLNNLLKKIKLLNKLSRK